MSEQVMSIDELQMDCTYPVPTGVESNATYICGKTSDTAVVPLNGGLLYRCPVHKGLVDGETTGAVRITVPIPRI